MPATSSFTLKANNGVFRDLQTECGISQPFDPKSAPSNPTVLRFNAIWDTGATTCVVSKEVAKTCGLKQIGVGKVIGVNSEDLKPAYLISLYLLAGVVIPQVMAVEGNLVGNTDILIGMNIITLGDFAITNKGGNSIFTFRVPSIAQYDYVKDHNASQRRSGKGGKHPRGRRR